jgi:uncharacterized OB-fold protein
VTVQERHQAELNAGRFRIQRCEACSRHVYFPRTACPYCGGIRLAWVTPAGTGRVHAVTTVRRKPAEGGDFNISLIDLDEGVRLMSRVEGLAPDHVPIGLRVRGRVQISEGKGLLVFDPVPEDAA